MNSLPAWVDGQLLAPGALSLEVEDSSVCSGQACYTSALVIAGRARWAQRHVDRLQRDTAALGLPAPDPRLVLRAFRELGLSCFDSGTGIVRVQASSGGDAASSRLIATARVLETDPHEWKALTLATPHPGPGPWPGVKRSGDPHLVAARSACLTAGLDEALLMDREGYVVEASRSSLVLLNASGDFVTPNPERGGVRSIALEILLESLPALKRQNLSLATLKNSQEVVAVNAVRGARRICTLDGETLGSVAGVGLTFKLADLLDRTVS